jgi:DNA-binding CsgD family transcriptional regulator
MGSATPPPTGAPTPGGLVARDAELDAIRRLLVTTGDSVRALVLEGDPGIGKTSLWEQGIALARAGGLRVLVVRASECDTGLPFAGLIDLLDGVPTEELQAVPGPQLRALEVALYRADPTDRPPEPQVISLAALSALRVLAAHDHLVVALDDLQWLDPASDDGLAYAARRLHGEPVTFLCTRRPGRRTALETAFGDEQAQRLVVGAISLGATRQLLASRLGLRLPHHLLRRIYDTTMGNPLFAIEMGRVLAGRDLDTLGDLPVPDHVEDLLGLRVADLDGPARRVLLALALDADLRVSQIRAPAGSAALQAAVDAGVVVVDGDRIRAAHPLLAAAAQRQADPAETRDLHRRLAEVAVDEQRRVRHLALASTEPDEELAARIDAAAAHAAARGATRLAIDLAAHAWRLTPPEVSDVDRVLALARHLNDAGEKQRLSELLGERLESLPRGAPRVTAYLMLTEGILEHGSADIAELLDKALAEAGDDPVLRGQVLSFMAENDAIVEVRGLALADARATEAVTLSEQGSPDDQRLALNTLVWTQALRGSSVEHLIERYYALPTERAAMARHPERIAGQRLAWRGEVNLGRPVLLDFRRATEDSAEAHALARLHLCELELRAGRWAEVEHLLDDWGASPDSDILIWPMYERCRGLLAAGRGDVGAAQRWAGRAVELAVQTGVRWDWLESTRALGLAALLAKDPPEAVSRLGAVWDHTQREGVLDPGAFPVGPDLVEALVETDDHEGAALVAETLAEAGATQDHPWARIGATRARATVELAAGDYRDHTGERLEAAAASYAALGLVFDEARTLLALGRAQRRAKKWGAARDVLERTVAAFEAIGSPGWADDARAELERVGARRPASEGGLTPTERRVADLAVGGLANKEIARTLVVTVNTVEFHLRNTYAKLGIRSRAQLAARLRELEEGEGRTDSPAAR